MKKWIPLLLTLLVATPLHAEPSAPAAQAGTMSDGLVRKVDVANGKITLKHGPIANLDMPAMSMVFRVLPPELLNAVKVGDTVKFHAESINGALTVTAIRAAQ